MALALSLNADGHGELSPTLQELYVKQDDGNYRLDADFPDSSGLKAKADELLGETKRERELRKAAEDRANALEAAQKQAAHENAKAKGDVESLEKSFQEQIAKLNEDSTGKVSTLQKQIYDLTVGQAATNLANELSIKGSAKALLPHIQNRLTLVEDENGKQVVKVLDVNGGKTLMTIEDLKQELRSDEAFKPLIAASGASGSGANGANGGAGHSNKSAKDYTEAERLEIATTNPELFRQLFT